MNECELRDLIADVRGGRLARRAFITRMAAWGLAAPFAAQILMHAGVAQAQSTAIPYKPTRRGGGGPLKLLFWQGPTLLNPHFATGTKDIEACQIFYEALVVFDPEGNMLPVLAAQVPTTANGGVSKDGRVVTWKLKQGVMWHDGKPFTADDVVFNWEYGRDPATAAVTSGTMTNIKMEKVDDYTVRVTFPAPTPFWALHGTAGLIPKHLFAPYIGAKSREAPANLKPVGTGPFKFVDFKPGDLVRAEINMNYHMPNRPYFDTLELKGGGDASSAARAVLQTGEFDFAWNLQVEDEVLKRMEDGGKGHAHIVPTGDLEFVQINLSDPWTDVDGERSSVKTRHFAFADVNVRRAFALLVDRKGIQEFIYGRTGIATANFVNAPARFRSPNTKHEFNIDKANALLDGAGWKKGADGIRAKNGRRLKLVFQTSVNGLRQKEQAVIKQACQKAGIEMELKAVTAAVFFSTDVANPDTNGKFIADLQMYAVTMGAADPLRMLDRFVSWEVASKANKWQGRNGSRYVSPEFDKLYRAAEVEMDPVKRAATIIAMNDLIARDVPAVPLISRTRVVGVANKLSVWTSPWDNDLAGLHSWYRVA
ncbi:peptide ABC transporter substrate-binding protein [Caenimonas koreensis]|uniref:peptide ABC transporter substrate-binding protein n=1 Tax=Caenimonas koreensis TaxID=367474 RepID=UPI0037841B96